MTAAGMTSAAMRAGRRSGRVCGAVAGLILAGVLACVLAGCGSLGLVPGQWYEVSAMVRCSPYRASSRS